MKKRYCVNCEKETPDTPCPYCGGGVFKNHKCDGGDDYGLVDCKGCEREMLSRLTHEEDEGTFADHLEEIKRD